MYTYKYIHVYSDIQRVVKSCNDVWDGGDSSLQLWNPQQNVPHQVEGVAKHSKQKLEYNSRYIHISTLLFRNDKSKPNVSITQWRPFWLVFLPPFPCFLFDWCKDWKGCVIRRKLSFDTYGNSRINYNKLVKQLVTKHRRQNKAKGKRKVLY